MNSNPFAILLAGIMAAALPLPSIRALASEPNTLTPEEAAAGWRLLFDGRATSGWHTFGKTSFPTRGWHVEDGCLMNPKCNGRPNGSGGDLVTNAKFTDFEFRFEWRIRAGGNSGVEYLFAEGGPKRKALIYPGDTGDSPVGFEYQILDDPAYLSKNVPARLTASIYKLAAAVNKTLLPAGEFNEGRIIVDGNHVEHWLNGRKVAGCELGSASLQRAIADCVFKVIPGFGIKSATSLALQDHGEEVAFRNLKIRELGRAGRPTMAASPPSLPPVVAQAGLKAADWRVWCWSRQDQRWIEHPLDKMTARISNGVLSARNTSDSHWPRAILVYQGSLVEGDFEASAEYRGQIESFDLQSASGEDRRITCMVAEHDDQWQTLTLSRNAGTITAKVGKTPIATKPGSIQGDVKGYFCFKLRPDETVEIRNLRIQHPP